MELELCLDPADALRLPRLKLLAPLKSGKARSRPAKITWHDGPDRALAQQGLALAEQRPHWRLERLLPDSEPWPPGAPPPVLAIAPDRAALGVTLPDQLLAVAALEGRTTSLALATELGPVGMTLLTGKVRTVAAEHRISRLMLEGDTPAVEALAISLTTEVPLTVASATLAAEALAIASGSPPSPRREGAPELPDEPSIAEAFAHIVGHLGDVILHLAPAAADGREGPEPVHQMRVAVRRLRSAIKVFRSAFQAPEIDELDKALSGLAKKLGPARDWDVFVTETAAAVSQAFPTEQRLQRLLAAAERRRHTCHDDLRLHIGDIEVRRLGIRLACLASGRMPAPTADDDEEPTAFKTSLHAFAAHVLSKRLKRVAADNGDLADLEPKQLHAIRLHAKRLRYAAEIFAPLYAGKATHRFIRRLSRLQDRLGALNDAEVSGALLAELAGGSHAFATGLVLGFVGARGSGMRKDIGQAWRKFRRLEPFWA